MDRKSRKTDQGVKQPELRYKDRGDVKKEAKVVITKADIEIQVSKKKLNIEDRGDSPNKNQKRDKTTGKRKDDNDFNIVRFAKSKNRLSHNKNVNLISEKNMNRIYDKIKMDVKPLDIDKRRKLAELYTFRKTNVSNSTSLLKEDQGPEQLDATVKTDRTSKKQTSDEIKKEKLYQHSQSQSGTWTEKFAKGIVRGSDRKPTIKTVTCSHDSTKVFKAVTFSDQSRHITPLKICIPNMSRRPLKSKSVSPDSLKSNSLSTTLSSSIEKSITNRKCKAKRKRIFDVKDPQIMTEVAKWAPLSVTQHTKPYYEAWVDTTPAAISRCTDDDNVQLTRQALIEDVKKMLESPTCPEPSVEDLSDEKYTGRIRVKHKNRVI